MIGKKTMTDHLPFFCKFKFSNIHNCMFDFYSTGLGLRDRDERLCGLPFPLHVGYQEGETLQYTGPEKE